MSTDVLDQFIALSVRALHEEDIDCLIDLFQERREAMHLMRAAGQKLSSDHLNTCIRREEEIVSKLEKMKVTILAQMENLAKTRKVVQKYVGSPVLPPQPVYFDIKT